MNARLAACVMLQVAASACAEEKVFRCGPDGRQYSRAPCGSAAAVDVTDPRTPDQQREAKYASARDARMAHELVQERRIRETAAARQGAAFLGPVRVNAAESAAPERTRKARHKSGDDSRLTPPLRSSAERL